MKKLLLAISTTIIFSGLFAQAHYQVVYSSSGNGYGYNYNNHSHYIAGNNGHNNNCGHPHHYSNHQYDHGANHHHPSNYRYPMSDYDFNEACRSIYSKSFDDSKLITAKQICRSGCLTSAQVREINRLFSFESSRLEFAKYAYRYVYDKSGYFKVNDSFIFESSIRELYKYIERQDYENCHNSYNNSDCYSHY